MTVIALRPVTDDDLGDLFRMMRDPESVAMAAFTADDPSDWARFDEHTASIRADPQITFRAVTYDGLLAGTISSFPIDGYTEVTYWIDRELWGRGIASKALRLLLEIVPARPLRARVASDNAASRRVLEKAGFRPIGTDIGYAAARATEIEETILLLD
jgi:RimJ/RimL family protein N-acetyltransferase